MTTLILVMAMTASFAKSTDSSYSTVKPWEAAQNTEIVLGGPGEEFNGFEISDRNSLRRSMKSASGSLLECFKQNKSSNTEEVTFRIELEDSGKVQSVSFLSSSLKNAKVEQCLLSRIQKISFSQASASKEPKTFDYPIKFKRKELKKSANEIQL